MQKEEYTFITEEQADLSFDFIQALFSENVDNYWSKISKVDKARVLGMYKSALHTDSLEDNISFYDYVKDEFMIPQREMYEKVKDNAGMATHLRYTDEGEPQIFLLENVTEPVIYEEATEVKVFPITLTLDTDINRNEITSNWKVRMYLDKEYETL